MPENTDAVDAGTTVDGTLTNGEETWYTIDLDAEDTISVVFSWAFDEWTEQRVEISISGPDSTVLDLTEVTTDEPPRTAIGATVPEMGTYAVRIASLEGEVPYSVTIDVADEDPNEPNNTRESATEIATGASVDGVVVGDEADWFAFNAVAGEGIELDLTARDLALNRDIEMALFDPEGTDIGVLPADQPSHGAYKTNYDFLATVAPESSDQSVVGAGVAEETGTHHVRVSEVGPDTLHGVVRGFTAYTLAVETVELDQYDPNERRETATPLTPGETIEAVAVGYDHDWYRFDAEEGDEITLDYDVTRDVDLFSTELTLYDPDERVIDSSDRSSEPSIVTAQTTGTYYLHIGQSNVTTPAAFRNRLEYALTVQLNEEVPPAAGVTFADQDSDGTRVAIDEVTVPESGFVAIYDERLITGEDLVEGIRGVSPFLETGSHDQVAVTLADPITETQRLWALTHRDTNDTREFDFVATAGDEDEPYEGETTLVMDDACITIR
ncbi:PPC domain-containing protein [Halalkalicoccus salilacus]|uniref:PPC domain-containing protein n=1 Tax=Halalkalicoccus TaxID=332246 RepID=UPI002F96CF7C